MLGLAKSDPSNSPNDEDDEEEDNNHRDDDEDRAVDLEPIPGPRKGFSVPVKVKVGRAAVGPLVVACDGDGGVQGFRWYADRLRMDEDGDVADEFVNEVSSEFLSYTNEQENMRPLPRFQAKYSPRPANVLEHALTHDGKLQLCVESQGRLTWV